MSIPLSSNFHLATGLPLDSRTVVTSIAFRDAIPSIDRYDGLSVYVSDDMQTWQLQGGTTNSDWKLVFGAGGAVVSVTGWNVDNTDPSNPIIQNLVTDLTLTGLGTSASPLSVVGSEVTGFVRVATTVVLPGTPIYNNGLSGVGATLTRSANGTLGTIDGIGSFAVNDRILVKNQSSQLQNGTYVVTQVGGGGSPYILTRTTDGDQTAELDNQVVSVQQGTTNLGKLFGQQTQNPVLGTSAIVYAEQTSGNVKQKASGTQVLGQIPWWTTTPKQLDKGTQDLTWIQTTKTFTVNSLLLRGGDYTGGSSGMQILIDDAATTAQLGGAIEFFATATGLSGYIGTNGAFSSGQRTRVEVDFTNKFIGAKVFGKYLLSLDENAKIYQLGDTTLAGNKSLLFIDDGSKLIELTTNGTEAVLLDGVSNLSALTSSQAIVQVSGYNSTVTIAGNGSSGSSLQMADGFAVLNPTATDTTQLRFLELPSNGSDYIGWVGPIQRTSNTSVILSLPEDDPTDGQTITFSAPIAGVSKGTWSDTGALGGTGSINQIAVWTDPNTITGYDDCWYDDSQKFFGIGTNTPDHRVHFKYETSYFKFGRYSALENGAVIDAFIQKRDGSLGSDIVFTVAEETGFSVTNGLANFVVGLDSLSQSGVSNLMSFQDGLKLQPYSGVAMPIVFYDDAFLQTISFAGPSSRTGDLKILWPINDPTDGQTMVFGAPVLGVSQASFVNAAVVATGGAANLVAYFTGPNDLTGEIGFEYDPVANILKADKISASIQFNKGTDFFGTQDTTLNNLRLGKDAGLSVTTGPSNTFLGISAGRTLTTADRNTFIGFEAGYTYNLPAGAAGPLCFVGYRAGKFYQGVSGHGGDVFIGDQAGLNVTTGYENTFVGHQCGGSIVTGIQNVGMGYGVFQSGTTGTQSLNTVIGFDAGRNLNGNSNTIMGNLAAFPGLVTGGGNIFIGASVATGSNNCNSNIVIGNSSQSNAVDSTILIGNSLTATETSELNIGGIARANSQFTKFGQLTGSITGTNVTLFGRSAGAAGVSANDNSFFGYNAGSFAVVAGVDNSGFGSNALQVVSSGIRNTGIGKSSLASVSTGSENAALGYLAGAGANSSRHVYLGSGSQGNHSDAISLGYGSQTTAAHQLVIGSYQTTDTLADSYIDQIFLGSGVTAAVIHDVTIQATGGSGTDIVGAALTIASGKTTGNAASPDINFDTSDPGSSGTTLNARTTKAKVTGLGDFKLMVAGRGIYVKEGSNATMGVVTLVAGTATVLTTKVTANSRIFLTSQVDGGTPGFLRVSTRTASTSFVITSSSVLDTSDVAWIIMEPS